MFDEVKAYPPSEPGDDRQRRPPVPVKLDLRRAFNQSPPGGGVLPDGWVLDAVIDGELICWRRDTRRRWWAEVKVVLYRGQNPGSGGSRVVMLVPAHAVWRRS
ncbi:hypothetical protein [Saccharopolyspora dendranthemae]|uniref:hypothetical protein n=1 Tax=Saccharopolyspora dendranthemae TaxID=1181886 RepID=UPI0011A108B7|nr:hypothetical protein [Saccharopolyspora dendranthemae]